MKKFEQSWTLAGILMIISLAIVPFNSMEAKKGNPASSAASGTCMMEKISSIREELPLLKEKNLLKAYSRICQVTAAGNDMENELSCIYDFISEAVRQKDTEAEGLARSALIYCWYNYDQDDSLRTLIRPQLDIMKKNRTWNYYYNSWSTLVENYIYRGHLLSALQQADLMYQEARKSNNNYGIGVAAYCVGEIYQILGRTQEAKKALLESIEALEQEEDITLLLSAYNVYGELLDKEGSYKELEGLCRKWEKELDSYRKKAENAGFHPDLSSRYLYVSLSSARAAIGLGNFVKAENEIATAEKYEDNKKSIARHKLLLVKARYAAATGQYAEAIRYNEENLRLMDGTDDIICHHTIEMAQAEYLMKNGDYQASAELYSRILPFHDELRNRETSRQADELTAVYEVDKLELESRNTRRLFYFALSCSALLLVIVGLYVHYSRRLKNKNRILYETLYQLRKAEEKKEKPQPQENDKSAILYVNLCKLMEEEQLYANPDVGREYLTERLGTNRTYLANAIKKYHGGSLSTFINEMRLKYAAELLTENPEMNINEIEEKSGFNSRATFSRSFHKEFGMTPTEYRNISREHKVPMTGNG